MTENIPLRVILVRGVELQVAGSCANEGPSFFWSLNRGKIFSSAHAASLSKILIKPPFCHRAGRGGFKAAESYKVFNCTPLYELNFSPRTHPEILEQVANLSV